MKNILIKLTTLTVPVISNSFTCQFHTFEIKLQSLLLISVPPASKTGKLILILHVPKYYALIFQNTYEYPTTSTCTTLVLATTISVSHLLHKNRPSYTLNTFTQASKMNTYLTNYLSLFLTIKALFSAKLFLFILDL